MIGADRASQAKKAGIRHSPAHSTSNARLQTSRLSCVSLSIRRQSNSIRIRVRRPCTMAHNDMDDAKTTRKKLVSTYLVAGRQFHQERFRRSPVYCSPYLRALISGKKPCSIGLDKGCCQFCAIRAAEFIERSTHVSSYGAKANTQYASDITVRTSSRYKFSDFAFSRG
jgi:hypothetical protein